MGYQGNCLMWREKDLQWSFGVLSAACTTAIQSCCDGRREVGTRYRLAGRRHS